MPRRARTPKLSAKLAALPWWASVFLAGVVYLGLRHGLAGHPPTDPALAGAARILAPLAGPIGLVLLLPAPLSWFRARRRRRLLDRQTGLESLKAVSWQDFEKLCGEAYRRQGFKVRETGRDGPDGGVDLELRKGGETWLVQCKRWRNVRVGVREVRELYGIVAGERAERGVLVTCGGFTPEARDFALGKPLDLVDGPALLDLVREVRRGPATAPVCPNCGAAMVLRTARHGPKAGGQFWGCSTFPRCRAILDIR